MRWETRTHWLWGLLFPSQWYLLSIALASLSLLTFGWTRVAIFYIGLALATIGFLGLFFIILHWRSFSLSIHQGEKALWERERHDYGFGMFAERRISMSIVGSTEFQQTLLGRIFDYGSISLGTLGGLYQWENIGNFRTLRRIIESQGDWMPPPRINLFNIFTDLIHTIIRFINRFLLDWRQMLNILASQTQIPKENFSMPNYYRFLKFAEKILFPNNSHRYESWIPMARLRNFTFTDDEIEIYQCILRMRRLSVLDLQGRIRRHKRIRTPKDIRTQIPEVWFRRAVQDAYLISLLLSNQGNG